jgi:aminoglycoside phosphotransferase
MNGLFNITNPIPPELKNLIEGYSSQPVTIGCSGARVYYLQAADKPGFYLKAAPAGSGVSFRAEVERLNWLKNRLPVPQVVDYRQSEAGEYLLLSEITGLMACDESLKTRPVEVVKLLAAGLRMLHSLDINGCPLDSRVDIKMEAARQRMQGGLVDETAFDDNRLGRPAPALFEVLLRTRPTTEDLVFTHGDYCLPNVILEPGCRRISGFIDLGLSGVADRYQDLALAARSLEYNLGREWISLLFEEYGLDLKEVDWAKIEFYQLLDEFF